MDSDQSAPFLPKTSSEEEEHELYAHDSHKRKPTSRCPWERSLCLHGGIILSYTIIYIIFIIGRLGGQDCELRKHDSNIVPVDFVFKPTTFHNLSQTKYAGDKPANVLKEAWEDLLKPMNMRFTEDEFNSVNQESVALPEGGGYLGWFGVFHSLHCVKMIRESFERAEQGNRTEEVSKEDRGHVHHCIELLRQGAMCQPDTSLTSFIWHPKTNLPMFNVTESTHTCVDWDAFMESTKSRVVSEEEMKRLNNPLLKGHDQDEHGRSS